MGGVRLVAIDLDGTLLNDEKHVSPANKAALENLLQQGVIVALATARDCASIRLKVPLSLPGLYFIGSGGALVLEVATGTVIWCTSLVSALAAESVRHLQKYGYPVFLNAVDDYWVDRYNARVQMIEARYNLTTRPFQETSDVRRPINRVSLAAPVQVLERAAAESAVAFGERLVVSLASPDWLDLLAPGAGKGAALAILQSMFGLGAAQTLAIGDYDSDLSLFERAAHRVAMGNAVPGIKAAATYITTSNNEDGVARALQMIF